MCAVCVCASAGKAGQVSLRESHSCVCPPWWCASGMPRACFCTSRLRRCTRPRCYRSWVGLCSAPIDGRGTERRCEILGASGERGVSRPRGSVLCGALKGCLLACRRRCSVSTFCRQPPLEHMRQGYPGATCATYSSSPGPSLTTPIRPVTRELYATPAATPDFTRILVTPER